MEPTNTKPQPTHRTRSGFMAGIYSTDNGGDYPVHGWIEEDGVRTQESFTADLRYSTEGDGSNNDLLPLPKKIKVETWVNMYPDGMMRMHDDKNKADKDAAFDRIACKHLIFEVEEGEGI
jgi:hypothetical protein